MVKIFSILLFISSLIFAEVMEEETPFSIANVASLEKENLLIIKIKTFLSEDSFQKNREFIKVVFSPESDFYIKDRVDVVKVAKTLKDNGLLKLFFKKPQELKLSFKTSGSPLFFVKIMGDTLRNIGYYRYVTTESDLDSAAFTWNISLNSEYATDPQILQQELNKSGCSIIDIQRNSSTDWVYSIDMSNGYLNVPSLRASSNVKLKRSLYAHWLNVSKIKTLQIESSIRDRWYPKIAYYDKQLHLLKVVKKDTKTRRLSLQIPKFAEYIKISDIYTLKNIKDNLVLKPRGTR